MYERAQSCTLTSVLSVWKDSVLTIHLDGAKVNAPYVQKAIAALGLEEKKLRNLPS